MEDRARRDFAAEGERDHQAVVDRFGIEHGKRAGVTKTDRTGAGIRLLAEGQLATTEHLRPGVELDVDLEAYDGLEALRHRLSPGGPRNRSPARVRTRHRAACSRRRQGRRSGSRPAGWPLAPQGSIWPG